MKSDNEQRLSETEDEGPEHLSQVEEEFAEQQLQVPAENWVDFSNSVRTQEVRPQSPEAQIGNWIHQNPAMFNENLSPPIPNLEKTELQVPLPDPKGVSPTLYADGVDFDNKYIPEIKPDSQEAIEKGINQNQAYVERIEANTGISGWSSGVHTYHRDEERDRHPWLDAAYHQNPNAVALDTTRPNTGRDEAQEERIEETVEIEGLESDEELEELRKETPELAKAIDELEEGEELEFEIEEQIEQEQDRPLEKEADKKDNPLETEIDKERNR